MADRTFKRGIRIPGPLSRGARCHFTARANLTLLRVSAVASNRCHATVAIGDSSRPGAFLIAAAVGHSGVPAEYGRDDFAPEKPPRFKRGELVVVDVDCDGAGGIVAQDVSVILTFAGDQA